MGIYLAGIMDGHSYLFGAVEVIGTVRVRCLQGEAGGLILSSCPIASVILPESTSSMLTAGRVNAIPAREKRHYTARQVTSGKESEEPIAQLCCYKYQYPGCNADPLASVLTDSLTRTSMGTSIVRRGSGRTDYIYCCKQQKFRGDSRGSVLPLGVRNKMSGWGGPP